MCTVWLLGLSKVGTREQIVYTVMLEKLGWPILYKRRNDARLIIFLTKLLTT